MSHSNVYALDIFNVIFHVACAEKKDLSPSEEGWGVDQQLISKLKEQYKKERQKGKKGMQSRQNTLVPYYSFVLSRIWNQLLGIAHPLTSIIIPHG